MLFLVPSRKLWSSLLKDLLLGIVVLEENLSIFTFCWQIVFMLTYCTYWEKICHLSSFTEKHWASFQSYNSLKWSFNASDHTTVLLHVYSNSTAFFINTGDAIEPSRWDYKNNHSGSEQRLWPIYPSISSQLYLRHWLHILEQCYLIPAGNTISSF